MTTQINSESSNVLNKLFSAAEAYKSKILNTDTSDFSSFLKENFDKIDKDGDNMLTSQEVKEHLQNEQKNPEVQKLIDNKNIESIMANIDLNQDGMISFKEVDPKSKVSDILSSAAKDFSHTKGDWQSVANNITRNIGTAFYLNDSARSALASAVNYIV